MSSVVISGDTSGAITLSAPAVAGTTTLTLPATSGTVLQSGTTVTEAQGGTGTTVGYYGFKNRIINGAMVIDQRNAGASVTPTTGVFTLDRWLAGAYSASSKFSVQQNASAVTPPTGFLNYLGVTSLSAYSVAAGDFLTLQQSIEGFNTADLGFGTASASTVTLSFWVRSSLTGTFGGALANSASDRSYPFSYTISVANTWEYKTVTIAGDTSGTWVGATNGIGINLRIGLGVGSTYTGTAGAWAGSNIFSVTGATSVVGTNGATFYITGVQLEKGSTATSFDYRPYGTELQLAQRFYEEQSYQGGNMMLTVNQAYSTTATFGSFFYKVKKRTAPTVSASGTTIAALNASASSAGGAIGFTETTEDGTRVNITGASGLVAGNASAVYFSYAKIKMDAEL